jgi:hypothetical protein
MKRKKYYIVGKIPKFDRIIVETKAQSTPLTHIYMTLTHIYMTLTHIYMTPYFSLTFNSNRTDSD